MRNDNDSVGNSKQFRFEKLEYWGYQVLNYFDDAFNRFGTIAERDRQTDKHLVSAQHRVAR